MLSKVQYHFLRKCFPGRSESKSPYFGCSKLRVLFGPEFFTSIAGKTVIDFGCGEGDEAVEMAQAGAKRVVGVDIRDDLLEAGRKKAAAAGVAGICEFTTLPTEPAEITFSLDTFEHFADPAQVLEAMSTLLVPDGEAIISFGPSWYHPARRPPVFSLPVGTSAV
jgi:2-polyprenyl-3-methyl-5-hydroxy-6-metoxy-1,4-benzoquinol methylase